MQKNITKFLTILFLILICSVPCFALEEFVTVPISGEQEQKTWQTMGFSTVQGPEDLQSGPDFIVSFDIAENGDILIGLENRQVLLLDKDLNMINSFKFTTDGDFYVRWEEEDFLLYDVRGSKISKISKEGQLIQLIQTDNHSFENDALWREAGKNADRKMDSNTYSVRNSLGPLNWILPNYSELIKTDASGNEIILYRADSIANIKRLAIVCVFIGIPIAFICGALAFIPYSKKKKHRNG